MPENNKNKQEVPQKILDKEGLKTSKFQGQTVVVPKDVADRNEKFIKNYSNIKNLMGFGAAIGPGEFANLFNYYVHSVLEAKISERMNRYDQMDFIHENDGSLSMARKVLKDEIIQADVFDKPITVTCKNVKFKKAIDKLFKELGVKNYVRSAGNDIITYGDAFWIMDMAKDVGVQKLIPIDVHDVKHRFEFSVADLKKEKTKLTKKFTGLQTIIELGSKVNTSASHFNRVLLGFQVNDTVFPFWQILHFRTYTTRKKLFPFGMPTFYESQSEARMYLNAKVIISMIRASAFMREHIQVKTADDMDPSEQWQLVQEVKQMMELFVSRGGKTNKDFPSFGDKLYYPEGLVSIEKQEAGFNFRDRFEDLSMMREDVFTSTGMPKGYFVGEGGQYVPIKALMTQDKKTARLVFDIQNTIINQLIKLVEVHFSFTGEFDPYEEEFGISLPYPIPDIDDTMIGISQSKMQYATGVIDSLKSGLDIVKIPEPIVKKLLGTYFPLSDSEIGVIIKQMKKDSKEAEDTGIDPYAAKYGDPFAMQKTQKDQMDIQTDQMQQQGEQPPEGQEAPPEGQQAPAEQKPQVDMQALQKKIDATGIPAEEFVKLSPEKLLELGFTEKEIQLIQQEAKQQMAAGVIPSKNGLYEAKFYEAIKKKPLQEAMEDAVNKEVQEYRLFEDKEEFKLMDRHFVMSSYRSSERNNSGVVELNESDEVFKAKSHQENKKVKIRGIDILEDTVQDQRYNTKSRKKKLKEKSLI